MKKYYLLFVFSIFTLLSACTSNTVDNNKEPLNTRDHIGNANNWSMAVFAEPYLYFRDLYLYRMNKGTGEISFACQDPTCAHSNCFVNKAFFIQADQGRLFCNGEIETELPNLTVYSSFGEVVKGGYERILEENTSIYFPSYVNGQILYGTENTIRLYDPNKKKIVKEFDFDDTLGLQQLYYMDGKIFFTTILGQFQSIDMETGVTEIIIEEKTAMTQPYGEFIYYILLYYDEEADVQYDSGDLYRMKIDGSDNQLIRKNCRTYNMLDDKIYFASYGRAGLFVMEPDGENVSEIYNDKEVLSISLFESYEKIFFVAMDHDNNLSYICDMDGGNLKELDCPKPMWE